VFFLKRKIQQILTTQLNLIFLYYYNWGNCKYKIISLNSTNFSRSWQKSPLLVKLKKYYYADGVDHLIGLQGGLEMWFVGFILYHKVCNTNVIFPRDEKSWFLMYERITKNGMQQDKYFHKRIPTYILTKLLVNTQWYIIRDSKSL